MEALEDALPLAFGDSRALVFYKEYRPALSGLQPEHDGLLCGAILYGVVEEVQDDLPDGARVDFGCDSGGQARLDVNRGSIHRGLEIVRDFRKQRGQFASGPRNGCDFSLAP